MAVADDPTNGVAILVANGKPAKRVSLDAEIILGVTLREINPCYILLSDGGVIKRVDLPRDSKAGLLMLDFKGRGKQAAGR